MDIGLYSIILFTLIAKICSAEIVVRQSKAEVSSYLVRAVVKVLTDCYANEGNAVVFAGNIPDPLLRTLSAEQQFSIAVIDNTTRIVYNSMRENRNPYKLRVFVVTASSSKQLEQLIREMKVSVWWNHMAYFLIIDWSSSDRCSEAAKLLYKAWNQNMIRAKVMCLKDSSKLQFYSYNPYTKHVPRRWQLDRIYTGKNFDSYSVFVREFLDDDGICEYLDFDATQNLDGANFVILSQYFPPVGNMGKGKVTNDVVTETKHVLAMLLWFLKVTPKYQFINERIGTILDYRRKIGMPWFPVPMHFPRFFGMRSYPYCQNDLVIMTQFRGHKTQLEKIISVLDIHSRIGTCLVLLITLIFFKCFAHQSLVSAFLNVVRIVSDAGFMNIPGDVASRIFLATLFCFAVTIHGIYQGRLASLLTQEVPIPDVKTMQDLAEMNYTIYVDQFNARYFSEPIFEGRVVRIPDQDCSDYVVNNPMAACVNYVCVLIDQATELKLHLASEPVGQIQWSFIIPIDTPLEDRINEGLARIQEAFLILPAGMTWMRFDLAEFEFDEVVKQNMVRRVITIDDISFALVLLGGGLAVSSMTFILEIIIYRMRTGISFTQVEVLH